MKLAYDEIWERLRKHKLFNDSNGEEGEPAQFWGIWIDMDDWQELAKAFRLPEIEQQEKPHEP